jgi:hypothetical protein
MSYTFPNFDSNFLNHRGKAATTINGLLHCDGVANASNVKSAFKNYNWLPHNVVSFHFTVPIQLL